MAFNLTEYIKRNLINGYKDGTFSESKVMQLAIGYLNKGLLTEEDIADIDLQIQSIKAEREAEKNTADSYEEYVEDAEMEDSTNEEIIEEVIPEDEGLSE